MRQTCSHIIGRSPGLRPACLATPSRCPGRQRLCIKSTTTPSAPVSVNNVTAHSSAASSASQSTPSAAAQQASSSAGGPTPSNSPDTSPSTSSSTHEPPPVPTSSGFQIKPIHIVVFSLIFICGAIFATMTLQFTADLEFTTAVATVLRRVTRSPAFRQLVVIACAILILRYGMNNFLMTLSRFSNSPVQWDKTKLYYILREVYQPLELLLFIAALCTLADAYVPSLIAVPKATVSHVVKSILSTSFILGFASVVFNLKSRFCKENAWQAEMKGDVTTQRRWEAYDKLGTFVIYVMSFVLGIQSIGLEVTSVLAIGGIGGLAIGLAGREICENLLNGFLIMSTNPFEVGDEVTFFHNNKVVEGFVIDIGWYRTLIRSFEREVYVVPNAVFSKNIVLNVSRKNREWRFYENMSIRVQDVPKANAIVQDIRRIVRNDTRVINKLHRRVFLDKITREDAKIYMSFYLEAANRDAFMAIKQDLLVSFVDCVERNGAKLATPRTVMDMDPEVTDTINSISPIMQGASVFAMAQSMAQGMTGNMRPALPSPATTITAEATVLHPSGTTAGAAQASGSSTSAGAPSTGSTGAAGAPSSSSSSGSGSSVAGPSPPGSPAAAAPPPPPASPSRSPDKSAAGAASSSSSSSKNGATAAPATPGPAPAVSQAAQQGGGQGAGPVSAPAPAAAANGATPVVVAGPSMPIPVPSSAGVKVGEVFHAPVSSGVVSVPVGTPVAYAGGISNNVVSAGPISTPNKQPATPGANGSSTAAGKVPVAANAAAQAPQGAQASASQPSSGDPPPDSSPWEAASSGKPGWRPHPPVHVVLASFEDL